MRPGVIAALGLVASTARAEPRLEASAFVGIDYFGDHTELGNSWAPEQVPGTSPVLGARLSYLAIPRLTERLPLQLAIEGELAVAPAFTGGSSFGDGGRMSYFAPVFGWRAHAALRLAKWTGATPFLVVGGGGATVASSSPFMSKESDPVVYYGPGVSIPVSGSWQFRIDLRHGIMPARESGATSTFEVQLGVSTTFGLPKKRIAAPVVEPPPPQPEVDEHDTDGDGLADRLDSCPKEPETINGIDDDDGCPEADADGDGVIGDADKCPIAAEDFDRFEDDDGCPETDNDGDGIEDGRDACPGEPETRNGLDDDDGCPDTVPPEITKALAAAGGVKFEATRARVTTPAKTALDPLLTLLRERPELRISILVHPDKAGNDDLAKRRGEAVKWYLVDQGLAEDRVETAVGGVVGLPAISITLLPQK